MEAFKNFIPLETEVIRDGSKQKLLAVDVILYNKNLS